jgi:hypothetical protein
VHDVLVTDVAVGEDNLVDAQPPDEVLPLVLGVDGDAGGVQAARELGRIAATGNVGDLCGSEGDNLVLRVISVDQVEVVEVAASRAENQDSPAIVNRFRRDGSHKASSTAPISVTGLLSFIIEHAISQNE